MRHPHDATPTIARGGIIGRPAQMDAAMLLVFGFGRIPIVSWLRAQAEGVALHAQQIGEWITTLGAYPSLAIGALLDSHVHDTGTILRESLDSERPALARSA